MGILDLRTSDFKVSVGRGQASFPMKRGSFKYKEELAEKHEVTLDSQNLNIERAGKRLKISFKPDREDYNRYWITFPVGKDEHFYGCGETFSEFDLKGQNVRIWVAEHQNSNRISKKIIRQSVLGKKPDKRLSFDKYESYYVQPTFTSSAKYYVHVYGTSYMEFDFRTEGFVTIYMRENAELEIGAGDSFEEVLRLMTESLGRQRKLPEWIYDGAVLGIQEGTAVVDKKLAIAEKYGIPVAGVWCQDWSGCRRTKFGYQVMWNWQWDKDLYPNLDVKIREWKKKGVSFLGYINPFIALEKDLYQIASEKGYCVKNAQGEDYLVTITTFPAAMVDFTNPKAYEWYKGIIKENMIGLGMGGWMADFGEYLPPDCVLYSGENPELKHNEWPAIWAKLNYEAVRECGVEEEVFFFTRAGYTDTIKYSPMMWNGDQHVDWSVDDGLPSVIPATLSLAMSGYGITHSDAGGYTTIMNMTRDKELLMRWEEMNVFTPFFRTHEGNQPAKNVQFDSDEELLRHMAEMVKLHVKLKPYLMECVDRQIENGTPVIKPLFFNYDEKQAYTEKTEYLLGDDILVAPVIREGATAREVYLPEDEWVNIFDGSKYVGGIHKVEAPIGKPSVFIKRSSKWYGKIF